MFTLSFYRTPMIYNLEGEYINSFSIAIWDGKVHSFKEIYEKIANYDENNLILYKQISSSRNDDILKLPHKPYALFSKHTGKITPLDEICFDKPIPNMIEKNHADNRVDLIAISYDPIIRNGDSIYITEFSSDIVFNLRTNGSLHPFLGRIPSVNTSSTKAMGAHFAGKSDRYWFFTAIQLEFDDAMEKHTNDIFIIPSKNYMYDKKTSQVYEQYKITNKDYKNRKVRFDFNNAPQNCAYSSFNTERLVEAYHNNELSGNLKEVAAKLKEDDNQVIMLIKFKE